MGVLFFYCPDCDNNKRVKALNANTNELTLNCPTCSCCYSVTRIDQVFVREETSKPLKRTAPKQQASLTCLKCSKFLRIITSRSITKGIREYYCYCPTCKLTPKITLAFKETLISFKKP